MRGNKEVRVIKNILYFYIIICLAVLIFNIFYIFKRGRRGESPNTAKKGQDK